MGSSRGAVLAALTAQEGREQGPREEEQEEEGRSTWPPAGRGEEWLAEYPGTRRRQRERQEGQRLEF